MLYLFLFQNCSYYWLFGLYIGYYVNHPLYTPPSMYCFFLFMLFTLKILLTCFLLWLNVIRTPQIFFCSLFLHLDLYFGRNDSVQKCKQILKQCVQKISRNLNSFQKSNCKTRIYICFCLIFVLLLLFSIQNQPCTNL